MRSPSVCNVVSVAWSLVFCAIYCGPLFVFLFYLYLCIVKWAIKSSKLRRTDNTMVKRKRTKRQIMIYKALWRKLKSNQHDPTKKREWILYCILYFLNVGACIMYRGFINLCITAHSHCLINSFTLYIQSGRAKWLVWAQTSTFSKMMRSCKRKLYKREQLVNVYYKCIIDRTLRNGCVNSDIFV